MRAVMIGGGVGGCAVAAALRGLPVAQETVIVERRPKGSPAGMGFILMPNGLEALEAIAPEHDWRSAGRLIDRVLLRTAPGRVLDDHRIETSVCVGRERFLSLLREAAGSAQFADEATITDLVRDADARTTAVRLEGGRVIEGDLFFGCDGAQSRTRGILFPEARLGGVVVKEIVSVAHSPALAAQLGTTFHKFHDEEGGFAVGLLAESSERVVWFVQYDSHRWADVQGTPEAMARFVGDRIAGWAPEVVEAYAATDFSRSHLWPTRDLEPLESLSCRNLALVGDAAHACLPFTSQGANGALADAAILKTLLAGARTHADVEAAFARYSERRRPHHRRMFAEGRRLRDAFLAPLSQSLPVIPLVD